MANRIVEGHPRQSVGYCGYPLVISAADIQHPTLWEEPKVMLKEMILHVYRMFKNQNSNATGPNG
ncbi:MAG: hypothetical protein F4Y82_06520 [Cenarchaeum sp. SB0665_bin_23]|nr:hypothetical protein [Cenarchaeum sp. SB0665_bin_23]MYC79630.1 hypothetical protein [Cenarchaeum sp. SB0661_bin_35]